MAPIGEETTDGDNEDTGDDCDDDGDKDTGEGGGDGDDDDDDCDGRGLELEKRERLQVMNKKVTRRAKKRQNMIILSQEWDGSGNPSPS